MADRLIYSENTTLKEAISLLDSIGYGVLPVVDENNILIGLITDGDIRKAILNKNLELEYIINKNPTTKDYRLPKKQLITFLKSIRRKHLPLVDENNRYVDMLVFDELEFNSKPNSVVIMAGGLGTRLGELTKHTPKPMLHVGNKPMLENLIKSFSEHGFTKFYISVNFKSEIIKRYFEDGSRFGVEIKYIEEDKRLGTVGALSLLDEEFDKPLFVINGDILTTLDFEQLLNFHNEKNADMTMCTRTYDLQIPYGVVVHDREKVISLEEKPIQKYSINAGIYVLDPAVLKFIPKNEYCDITDLITVVLEKKYSVCSYEVEDYWLDIGQIDDYNKAQGDLQV